jgi:hypothetical protein
MVIAKLQSRRSRTLVDLCRKMQRALEYYSDNAAGPISSLGQGTFRKNVQVDTVISNGSNTPSNTMGVYFRRPSNISIRKFQVPATINLTFRKDCPTSWLCLQLSLHQRISLITNAEPRLSLWRLSVSKMPLLSLCATVCVAHAHWSRVRFPNP